MTTKIRTWGNSQGLYLPKKILLKASLAINDPVEINVENGAIVIRRDNSSDERKKAWESLNAIRNAHRDVASASSSDYRDERNEYLDEKYGL